MPVNRISRHLRESVRGLGRWGGGDGGGEGGGTGGGGVGLGHGDLSLHHPVAHDDGRLVWQRAAVGVGPGHAVVAVVLHRHARLPRPVAMVTIPIAVRRHDAAVGGRVAASGVNL